MRAVNIPSPSHSCAACVALLAEVGDELFGLYRRKLLQRGWAGPMTPAERSYVRAHAPLSDRQHEALARARSRSPVLGAISVQGTGFRPEPWFWAGGGWRAS
jgi:hypothetical protein